MILIINKLAYHDLIKRIRLSQLRYALSITKQNLVRMEC